MGILQKYFTINIENTEQRFLDQQKLVQFYGAVSLVNDEFLPKCSKCQAQIKVCPNSESNQYIQSLRAGKVLKCKEESKNP